MKKVQHIPMSKIRGYAITKYYFYLGLVKPDIFFSKVSITPTVHVSFTIT